MRKVAYVRATGIYDDSRATKEIIAIASCSEQVYVLAWDRKGMSAEKCAKVFEPFKNVSFIFYDTLVPGSIGMRNIDKLIKWNAWIYNQLSRIEKLDRVHACNLDSGIGAYYYCKKNKCELIYDIYDYYVDSHDIPIQLKNIVENQEIKIINYAEKTIICTEERREQIAKSTPKEVVVIYNSPDVDRVKVETDEYDYVYCGTLGGGRLIEEIFEKYAEYPELKFAIAGSGTLQDKAVELSRKYKNFYYFGTIEYSEVLKLERKAKVLSAIYKPTIRNHQLCAPNKFYESLALDKPVIVCNGTGIDRTVLTEGIGRVISYDADEFYCALISLIDAGIEKGRARRLYEQKYSWDMMRKRIELIYNK